jgi:mRNA interferase MazF
VGGLVKGDVVVIPFPFSDLSATKRRPALVVATLGGDDVILCQITSRVVSDADAVPIRIGDFSAGRLRLDSNVRPNRLFTADSNLVLYRIGALRAEKLQEIIARIVEILSR